MPYCMNLRSPLHDYALAALAVSCVSLHRTWPSAGKHINFNPICAKLTRLTWELCVCHVHVRYDARRVSDFGPSGKSSACFKLSFSSSRLSFPYHVFHDADDDARSPRARPRRPRLPPATGSAVGSTRLEPAMSSGSTPTFSE